jgi:hypothetical protein
MQHLEEKQVNNQRAGTQRLREGWNRARQVEREREERYGGRERERERERGEELISRAQN